MKAKDSIYQNSLQDNLIENRKKIIELKYNSPTFKVQNLISHEADNKPATAASTLNSSSNTTNKQNNQHIKLTQYSNIDHL